MPLDPTPPYTSLSGTVASAELIRRFGGFVGCVRQAIVSRLERGGDRAGLGPLGLVLWTYLGRTLRRLAALQAQVDAGTLRPTPARSERTRAGRTRRSERPGAPLPLPLPLGPALPCGPALPRGPVLLRFHAAHLAPSLAALIEDPAMQALLAATPLAARLLRPLWRRLSPERLPVALRLPSRPRVRRKRPPQTGEAARRSKPTRRSATSRYAPHWAPHGPGSAPPARPIPRAGSG